MASGPLWAGEVSLEGGNKGKRTHTAPHLVWRTRGSKDHKDRFLHSDQDQELGIVLGSDPCKLGTSRKLLQQDTVLEDSATRVETKPP